MKRPGPTLLVLLWHIALVAGTLGYCPVAAGDEFVLSSGGRIRGKWLNASERPQAGGYAIRTKQGVRLVLEADQVAKVVPKRSGGQQYERIAPTYPDTVEAQWELAEWCRAKRLLQRRRSHLRRIIELDPNHERARYALGYSQLEGDWATQRQVLEQRGYVLYKGRWRLPQEVDLMEQKRRRKQAERRWFLDLKRWRGQLPSDKRQEALEQLRDVRDPHAVKALGQLLEDDRNRTARQLYVEVLGQIRDEWSTDLLIRTALNDRDEEIFHTCLDQLVPRKGPQIVEVLVEALKDANNLRVNRAAYALGRLQARSAMVPLIDALVTRHEVTRPDPSGKAPGTVTTGIARRGDEQTGSLFSVQHGPQTVQLQVRNQGVLDALEEIAGLSFGYDQRAWRSWQARRLRQSAPAKIRRQDD